MRIVDLRSDTLTLPTEEMRRAMAEAPLGDDSYDGDPTVLQLEELATELTGKENALLVISGTMGNLVSLLAHTTSGDEIIVDIDSHIYRAELGGLARLGGLMCRPLKTTNGSLDPNEVESVIRTGKGFSPRTTLICIENTHNLRGGTIITPDQLAQLADVACKRNIPIHMDGARIFNAAVALECKVREITKFADSIMFCLSKGLSAPLGSIIVGSRDFIERAKYFRQMVGGGMRQAGVFAAAGIVALNKMIDRLIEDHRNAQYLAKSLKSIDGLKIDLDLVQTNIVNVDVSKLGVTSPLFVERMAKYGIRAFARAPYQIRLVTYRGISVEDIDYAIKRISDCSSYFKRLGV